MSPLLQAQLLVLGFLPLLLARQRLIRCQPMIGLLAVVDTQSIDGADSLFLVELLDEEISLIKEVVGLVGW